MLLCAIIILAVTNDSVPSCGWYIRESHHLPWFRNQVSMILFRILFSNLVNSTKFEIFPFIYIEVLIHFLFKNPIAIRIAVSWTGNPTVAGRFPHKRPVIRVFYLLLAQTSCWTNSRSVVIWDVMSLSSWTCSGVIDRYQRAITNFSCSTWKLVGDLWQHDARCNVSCCHYLVPMLL